MATDTGHTVLMPPYHCELNLIRLVWVRVKQEVASKNIIFKPIDAERLLRQAANNVTAVHWHDQLNLKTVIIPLDASDTEEEGGDDDEADDEDEGEEVFGVQPLEWN
ncbi:hypothetical protein HPB47_026923 [Ixodes persulcatus]|uniref:Uncharacterized protein n=1 Tax=Ixodes persulcatus TaxID=34615 RepID=A0AC60PYZ0_IXOPE|nr:hypothetical protein HPB47_026923 [Ixodes persulcatus]